jgi:hypothetical protein
LSDDDEHDAEHGEHDSKDDEDEDAQDDSDSDDRHGGHDDDDSVVVLVVPTSFLQDPTTSTSPSLEIAKSRLDDSVDDGRRRDGEATMSDVVRDLGEAGLARVWLETPRVGPAARHWTCLWAIRGES